MMIGRAELIATTELLNEATLLKEIFGFRQNTLKNRKKKRLVLKQLQYILDRHTKEGSRYHYSKEFIIYSFIKLWHEGNVSGYDFEMAWLKHMLNIVWRYKDWYDENNIEEIQQTLVVV